MAQENVPDGHSLHLRALKNMRGAGQDALQQEDILRVEDADGNAVLRIAADGTATGLDVAAGGSGDMLKSVYDANNDGKVAAADAADSVPWTGVTGKPSTFPPESHSHSNATTGAAGFMAAADKTKLDGVEAGATADQTAAEIETAYNAQVPEASQVEAESGSSTSVRRWTPQRIGQAIAALAAGGGGSVASVNGETGAVQVRSLREPVAQTAHGFSAENVLYRTTGGAWALARADAAATATAFGIVESVPDANSFVLVTAGEVALTGKAAGTTYYLSAATAGLLTATAPSANGQFVVPILTTFSATEGLMRIGEPVQIVTDPLPVAEGGTGATNATDARTGLGLGSVATRTAVETSVGAADAGKVPHLDSTGKLDSSVIPAGGGTNATQIQGVNVVNTAPTDGQILKYVAANSRYEPAADATGGGGTGTKTWRDFDVLEMYQPVASFALFSGDATSATPYYRFDRTTEKNIRVRLRIPQGFTGPTCKVTAYLAFQSATSGVVKIGVKARKNAALADNTFDAEVLSSEVTVPGTAGNELKVEVNLTNAQIDDATEGDSLVLNVAVKTSGYSGTQWNAGECYLTGLTVAQQ